MTPINTAVKTINSAGIDQRNRINITGSLPCAAVLSMDIQFHPLPQLLSNCAATYSDAAGTTSTPNLSLSRSIRESFSARGSRDLAYPSARGVKTTLGFQI